MKIRYLLTGLVIVAPFLTFQSYAQMREHPNVIIILTDDQGYGDLGFNGNPHIQTPVLNQLAAESVRLNNFYVSPVCAPTRSSLMTGRYSLRTGVRDTYNGGAIMASNEITIAEMLKQANYATGIFGKWHLGDNYPSRPMEQGFDESVVHLAGGMGQVGDITNYFRGDSSYFDPVLWHNGKKKAYKGYCTDIFTREAIRFIERNRDVPFFCYLSFNAPHTPLQVPDEYYRLYRDIDPATGFEKDNKPFPFMGDKEKEAARRVYAMVTNIDDNTGVLLKKIDDLNLREKTLVIFLTDNGPQQPRFVGGMRGRKGSVYQGGVRVPCYMRYPSLLDGNRDIETVAAHIDILPTLAQICHVELPEAKQIDGKNLLPLLMGHEQDWEERPLFFYWTRRYPELYHNIALRKGRYKLVGNTDYDAGITGFELFNMEQDPFEQQNIIRGHEAVAITLRQELDKIYREVIASDNLTNPPLIEIGNHNENPVILNRNDAGGQRGIWAQEEIYGKWNVRISQGTYNFRFKFIKPVEAGGRMLLETNGIVHQKSHDQSGVDVIEMNNVSLPNLEGGLIPVYLVKRKQILPFWIEIESVKQDQ